MNIVPIISEFIGDSTFDFISAKHLFSNNKEINTGMICQNRLALTMNGVLNRSLNDAKGLQTLDYSVYQIFDKNDLVFKLIDLENIKTSRVGIVHEKGIMSPAYIRLKPNSNINARFYYWYFYAIYLNNVFNKLGGGIRQNLVVSDLLKLPVPYINAYLQDSIIKYIDKENNRISSLISEKQNFIKLLQENRKAMISHVVTKGLNPNVTMKDSGVEWIGEIPEHWEVTKLRYLGQCQNGINIGGEFFGKGHPFISYGDVYNNKSLPMQVKGLVESTEKDREIYSVKSGDVLFTRTSETIDEIGFTSVCHKDFVDAVFAGFLIRFRPKESAIQSKFSEYYFQNEKLRAFFVKEMNLVTRASLSQELLKRMPVVLPPENEQAEIASNLERKTGLINEIINETKKSIELLKERRTALISAAVTGKIDLREES